MMRSLGRCPTCQGAGTLDQRVQQTLSGRWETRTITCPQCHGDGEAWIRVDHASDSRAPVAILTFALLVAIAVVVLVVLALASPKPVAAADGAQASSSIGGWATWYDAPSAQDAAAGPTLREWLGPDWRGRWVRVSLDGRAVTAQLTDFCACGDRHGQSTVLDLDDRAFSQLAPLSTGVALVTVEVLPAAPPTDADLGAVAVAVADTMPVWRLPVVAGLVAFVLAVVAYVVPGRDDER